MKILIGADFVPTQSNLSYFNTGNVEHLFGTELLDVLKSADVRIFNLEVPITDVESPISKCGPNLIAPVSTITGYKAAGVDILTLANNHIMDQGVQGLNSTVKILRENHIAYLGVGNVLAEASKPYILTFNDKKIGVYACAEHEFSIVTDQNAGANPFDPLESPDHVEELKKHCDYVIVLYHGGKEHYRYPSPELRKRCRKLIDKGANLILCQHTHCIGCEEEYHSGRILYGQGNFLFDHSTSEYWQTSLLVQVDEKLNVSYIPLMKQDETVRLAPEEKANLIMADFKNRSYEITQPGRIEQLYMEYAKDMLDGYLQRIGGRRTLFYRIINKLTGHRLEHILLHRKYKGQQLLSVLNCLECEAHRELFSSGIRTYVSNRKK